LDQLQPTARPSVQVTTKTEDQHFSTTAGFKPVQDVFLKNGSPPPIEGSAQVPTELILKPFIYSNTIKPLLKR